MRLMTNQATLCVQASVAVLFCMCVCFVWSIASDNKWKQTGKNIETIREVHTYIDQPTFQVFLTVKIKIRDFLCVGRGENVVLLIMHSNCNVANPASQKGIATDCNIRFVQVWPRLASENGRLALGTKNKGERWPSAKNKKKVWELLRFPLALDYIGNYLTRARTSTCFSAMCFSWTCSCPIGNYYLEIQCAWRIEHGVQLELVYSIIWGVCNEMDIRLSWFELFFGEIRLLFGRCKSSLINIVECLENMGVVMVTGRITVGYF